MSGVKALSLAVTLLALKGMALLLTSGGLGGVGPVVSPKTALAVGLKVDSEVLPDSLVKALDKKCVNLDDPATTLPLLNLDAVVGVKGFFNQDGAEVLQYSPS